MIIKNYQELAGESILRAKVLEIVNAGIERVLPKNLVTRSLLYNETFNSVVINNNAYDILRGRIFVIGGGKANALLAKEVEKIIKAKNITAGIVNATIKSRDTKVIDIIKAGHPLPNRAGVKGVKKMLALKEKYHINKKDLVICLLSGGASALLPAPVAGISLGDQKKTTLALLASGANISEINCVRKHLSQIKGGQLADFFAPAKVVSLIISDVIGNDLEIIGSGPTVADSSTFGQALSVIKKYGLEDKIPISVKEYLFSGARGEKPETPKELNNVDNYIIGDSVLALDAMSLKAKSLGLRPIIITTAFSDEPLTAVKKIIYEVGHHFPRANVLLFAGEITPHLSDNYGLGGRNQHLAAIFSQLGKELGHDWVLAAVASDGVEYLSKAAGAIVDSECATISHRKGLQADEYLRNFNSNKFLKKLGNSLVFTGSTGTNIGDLIVLALAD